MRVISPSRMMWRRQTVVRVIGIERMGTILPNERVRESLGYELPPQFVFVRWRHFGDGL